MREEGRSESVKVFILTVHKKSVNHTHRMYTSLMLLMCLCYEQQDVRPTLELLRNAGIKVSEVSP